MIGGEPQIILVFGPLIHFEDVDEEDFDSIPLFQQPVGDEYQGNASQ